MIHFHKLGTRKRQNCFEGIKPNTYLFTVPKMYLTYIYSTYH